MIKENTDFDIYMTLGMVLKGKASVLEQILEQIKNDDDIVLVFTKTSAGKLIIQEMD